MNSTSAYAQNIRAAVEHLLDAIDSEGTPFSLPQLRRASAALGRAANESHNRETGKLVDALGGVHADMYQRAVDQAAGR